MNNYEITVKGIGYTTTSMVVKATSLAEAKKSERAAVNAWLLENGLNGLDRGTACVGIVRVR